MTGDRTETRKDATGKEHPVEVKSTKPHQERTTARIIGGGNTEIKKVKIVDKRGGSDDK